MNDEEKFIDNTNGMITINDKETDPNSYDILSNHFDVFVGMVTGKEEVFKMKNLLLFICSMENVMKVNIYY